MVFDNQISSPSSFTICIDPSQKKLSHIPLTPIQRSPIANHFFGVTLFLFSPVLPQFQTNPFINQILIISFKHNSFRSNTQTLSNQAHSNKFFFQTTQINGHERDRNWRERRRSDFKIVRENRIGAFSDVPEQREKPIGVGHGRPNSTRLSPLRKLAAKPLLMAVTVSASGS